MLKRIQRGNPKDCEYVKTCGNQFAAVQRAHESGTLEMFKVLVEIERAHYPLGVISKNVLKFRKYPLIKVLLNKNFCSNYSCMIDLDILINCLPESLAILERNSISMKDGSVFVKEVMKRNLLKKEHLLLLLGLGKEIYLEGRRLVGKPKDNRKVYAINSSCLECAREDNYQFNSELCVRVSDYRDLDSSLNELEAIRLYFDTTEIPPREFMEQFTNIKMIYNPYFLAEYNLEIKFKWLNADFQFFQELSSVKNEIKWITNQPSPGKARVMYIILLMRGFSNIREILDEFNRNITRDELEVIISRSYEMKDLVCTLLNHPIISHALSYDMLGEIQKENFKFANFDIIGDRLKYIPFDELVAKSIATMDANLTFEDGKVLYRRFLGKSARF